VRCETDDEVIFDFCVFRIINTTFNTTHTQYLCVSVKKKGGAER
jgi:hypothetical protein